MSTTYPPRFVRYVLSSQKERDAAKESNMTPGFYGDFPSAFGLYYSSPGKDFLSQKFYLVDLNAEGGAGGQRRPLYAVSYHKGPGSYQVTIYSTTEHGTTPMSIVTNESRYSNSITVTLAGTEGNATQIERVQYTGFRRNSHSFSVNGEAFELREDRTKRPKERQIVWLNAASSRSSHVSEIKSADDSSEKEHEDEVQILATWREGSIPNRSGQLATFQFASSAIQIFGKYWALLSISSVLAVCHLGGAIEGARSWYDEKKLEKGYTGQDVMNLGPNPTTLTTSTYPEKEHSEQE